MIPVYSPVRTATLMKKYGINFKKKYGQNFLIDGNVLDNIVIESGVTKEDFVIEIGPGIGSMTQMLAEKAREVVAIEIDNALIPVLEETVGGLSNVTILNEDILKVDLKKLVEEKNDGKPCKVVANLPYYITTPIVMGLFENDVPLESITIMIQKEVADRMRLGPGTKDYGALSLAVQYYSKPELVLNVSPSCFVPQPKVGSSVIKLEKYGNPPVKANNPKFMFKIIKGAFGQRRKTLVNALSNYSELNITKEEILEALNKMGLDARIRGEKLTLEQFCEFSNILSNN